MRYIIVVFPTLRSISERDVSNMSVRELNPLYEKISAEDYRWNAEQFNEYGAKVKRDGLQLGYHNHAIDLKTFGRSSALGDPHRINRPRSVGIRDGLRAHDSRARPIRHYRICENIRRESQLLHLKDLNPGYGISASIDTEEKDTNAELGAGVIDWKALFQVAERGNIANTISWSMRDRWRTRLSNRSRIR